MNDITSGISGGSLIALNEYIASSGTSLSGSTGSFSQSGGINTLSGTGSLYLGVNAADSGAYGLGSSATITAPTEYVGLTGTGYFGESGGNNTTSGSVGRVNVGNNVGSIGTYALRGGLLNSFTLSVGNSGVGSFIQSGGLATLTSTTVGLTLGNNTSALGTYTLSGGSVGTVNEWVGNLGVGYFVQSSGTNTATSSIVIANSAGSVGNYTLNNGSISSTAMQVANAGTGNFMQLGGLNAVSGWLTIGNTAGSYGTYTMLGGGLSVAPISGGEVVGNSGTGIFTQNKGTNTIGSANGLTLGSGTGSFGMYTLGPDPSCLLTGAANEIIGQAGTGIFIQTGGSNLFAPGSTTEGFLYIGNSGGNGTYSLSGSGQLNTTREFIGADQNGKKTGTGQFLQTGGTSNDSLNFTAGLVIGPSSRYVLGGGTLHGCRPHQ